MRTLAKYHVYNHRVIGEKTFKNILIGPGKLAGLRGPFLERPGNLSGPLSVFSDKCFLTEITFLLALNA